MKRGIAPLVATAGAIAGGLVVIVSLFFLTYLRSARTAVEDQEGTKIDHALRVAVVSGVILTLGSAGVVWRWSPRPR